MNRPLLTPARPLRRCRFLLLLVTGTHATCSAQDWTHFCGDAARTSLALSQPDLSTVRWSLTQHAGQPLTFPAESGVVAAAGVVLTPAKLGSADVLLCVEGDGAVRWAAPIPAPVLGSWSTPAVDTANAVVAVASGSGVLGLRLSDGSAAWSTPLGASIVNTSPCITSDRGPADRLLITTYAPFGVGRLTCINVDPFDAVLNPHQPGAILWSVPIGAASGNTPAYLDGRIYVSCVEAEPGSAGAVMCFELADVAPAGPLWRTPSPAGQGYFSGIGIRPGNPAAVYAATYAFSGGQTAGELVALDAQSGAVLWSAPANRTDATPIPLPGGRVLLSGGLDGFGCVPSLQLFDAAGKLEWDTALATWNDLNGNQQMDPGEYLRVGHWTHQPIAAIHGSAAAIIAGEPPGSSPSAPRLLLLRPDVYPSSPAFIAASFIGAGHTPAIAGPAGSAVVVYTTGPAGLIALGAAACYANCDGSTSTPMLNVDDFVCFQQCFAAGDAYANCDNSTAIPVLNVNDFVCFQQTFAGGCP